jgi:hypothetical protein
VNLKIPLDQVFSGVFTDARSGERTPTGAVRRGLRPSPHRSRGTAEPEHGQCSRPPRTGLPNSFGRKGATTSRRPSRETVRASGQTGPAPPSGDVGNGDLLERSRVRGNLSSANGAARRPGRLVALGRRATWRLRAAGGTSLSGGTHATGSWSRSRRNWGHPNWTQRGRFRRAPGPRARATGSA